MQHYPFVFKTIGELPHMLIGSLSSIFSAYVCSGTEKLIGNFENELVSKSLSPTQHLIFLALWSVWKPWTLPSTIFKTLPKCIQIWDCQAFSNTHTHTSTSGPNLSIQTLYDFLCTLPLSNFWLIFQKQNQANHNLLDKDICCCF